MHKLKLLVIASISIIATRSCIHDHDEQSAVFDDHVNVIVEVVDDQASQWSKVNCSNYHGSDRLQWQTMCRLPPIDSEDCGQRDEADLGENLGIGKRIYGGTEAQPGAWPSACFLQSKKKGYSCGATLVKNKIGEFYLITAAHCIKDVDSIKAVCGQSRHCEPPNCSQGGQIINVIEEHVHGSWHPFTLANDIAVLKLENQPRQTKTLKAACLPNEDHHSEVATVVGWGAYGRKNGKNLYKPELQQVEKNIWPDKECHEAFKKSFWFWAEYSEDMMCAYGGVRQDACYGDSGGPLYTNRHGRWTLTGVVSFAEGCGLENLPTFYTNVFRARHWIDKIINS